MSENKKHPNAEYIIAFAEGKQLQFFEDYRQKWVDFQGEEDETPEIGPWNCDPEIQWCIKPEQQWVRVAAFDDGLGVWTQPAGTDEEESRYEASPCFSRWLSDRLYYTPKDKA